MVVAKENKHLLEVVVVEAVRKQTARLPLHDPAKTIKHISRTKCLPPSAHDALHWSQMWRQTFLARREKYKILDFRFLARK